MRVLKVRVIVNETDIYELPEGVPLTLPCVTPITSVVIGNGFHFSRALVVTAQEEGAYVYTVDCIIDDINLVFMTIMTFVFFGFYIWTGLKGLLIAANIPPLYFVYAMYFMRKSFILIKAVNKI